MATASKAEEKTTRKSENKRRQRRRDASLGDLRLKMRVPDQVRKWAEGNNKVLRWINDQRGKVQAAQANDWDFVNYQGDSIGELEQPGDLGDCYSMIVGSDNGRELRAYLMCKEKDWYEADQTEKQAEVDMVDKAIHEGTVHNPKVEDAQYVKDIKYEPKGRLRS